MRVSKKFAKRALGSLLALVALSVVFTFGATRYAKNRLAREGAKRGLMVEVERTRLVWMGIRFEGVRVRPESKDAETVIEADLPSIEAELTSSLALAKVTVVGGDIRLRGPLRRRSEGDASRTSAADDVEIDAHDLRISYRHEETEADAEGVAFTRRDGAMELYAESLHAARGGRVAHVTFARASWARTEKALAIGASKLVVSSDEGVGQGGLKEGAKSPRALRQRILATAAPLFKLPPEAVVRIAELELPSLPAARAEVSRDGDVLKVDWDPGAGYPVAVDIAIPIGGGGDIRLGFRAGPGLPAWIGKRGPVDASAARIALSGHVLVRDDDRLPFELDAQVEGLTLNEPHIAKSAVEGIQFHAAVRGTLEYPISLTIEEAEISRGEARARVAGSIARKGEAFTVDAHVTVPEGPCQAWLDAFPKSLTPSLVGIRARGALSASLALAFDSSKPREARVEYHLSDDCKIADVPAALAKEAFKKPFAHARYAPDGSRGAEVVTGPGTPSWVAFRAMSRFLPVSVVMTEDQGFFRASGFRGDAIAHAIATDLKAGRFVRGGSTLTAQLAKNLFLSREKTVSRKLQEAVLTKYLAAQFEKEEILELYLNVVEFGPNVYGVREAARHYFGKGPGALTFVESLALASILPFPVKGSVMKHQGLSPAVLASIRRLMALAAKNGLVSEADCAQGQAEDIAFIR